MDLTGLEIPQFSAAEHGDTGKLVQVHAHISAPLTLTGVQTALNLASAHLRNNHGGGNWLHMPDGQPVGPFRLMQCEDGWRVDILAIVPS